MNIRQATVVFAFDEMNIEFLGVIKKKPDWQVGLINGIGGKMDDVDGGSLKACALREFREEAGIELDPSRMSEPVIIASSATYRVSYHKVNLSDLEYTHVMDRKVNDAGEQIVSVCLDQLFTRKTVPNLRWAAPFVAVYNNRYKIPLAVSEF